MHYNVKECSHVPTNESRWGNRGGLGHDALVTRYLRWNTAQRVSLHLLGCPPSPYTINVPLGVHRVNCDSLTLSSHHSDCGLTSFQAIRLIIVGYFLLF